MGMGGGDEMRKIETLNRSAQELTPAELAQLKALQEAKSGEKK